MKEWNVPGLAIAVIRDGRVICLKGYGYRDLEAKTPVTPGTLFSIASATKSFTATLAAMLVEEKKIDWDTPLKAYFPEFRLYDPMATEKVTLRDMLSHRIGIPRQEFYEVNIPVTRKEAMEQMRYFEPAADFRSSFQYCNMNYTVAGYMLGERAGKSWEALIRERIFEPLGMSHTVLSVTEMQKAPDFARPYIDWEEKPEVMEFHNADFLGPAGAVVSSAEDLSRWILWNLNKGKVGEKQLLGERSLLLIQSPQVPIPQPRKYKEQSYPSYGLGWFIDFYRGHLHVHHGGVLYGFTSLVSMLPEENIGLVILANLNGTPLTTILENHVYDQLLKLEPIDWDKRTREQYVRMKAYYEKMEKAGDPDKKAGTEPSHPLDEYAGTYKNEGYGAITVVRDGDGLKARLSTIECPLRHYHYDVFDLYHSVKRLSWRVSFRSDLKGEIASFALQLDPGLKDVIFSKVKE
jgi:CubicO group peptidase (beta-lactamase class C family)